MQMVEDGSIEFDQHVTHSVISRCDAKCTICLDEFADNKPCHELQCGHTYHTACILTWFRNGNPSCPLCRDEEGNVSIVSPSEAVRMLKKISKRSSAPARLKRAAERLQKAEEQRALAKRTLRDFEHAHAKVLREVSCKRRKLDRAEHKLSQKEMTFIMPNKPYGKGVEVPLIIFPPEDLLADSPALLDFFA